MTDARYRAAQFVVVTLLDFTKRWLKTMAAAGSMATVKANSVAASLLLGLESDMLAKQTLAVLALPAVGVPDGLA